jgi:O-antigen ligase
MRKTAWISLVLFVFSIPWEYSLDFGVPFGNIARLLGLVSMLASGMAVFSAGKFRRPGLIHWLTLMSFVWLCGTILWTVTPHETLAHLRGYAQEMVLIWLVWEFAASPEKVRVLLRAWLAGSWVLAVLTIAGFAFSVASAAEQVRFVAIGQDPNDVARYLGFGFPIAGLLLDGCDHKAERLLWLLYFPVGIAAVLLTASRSGLLIAILAFCGCGIAALRRDAKGLVVASILVGSALVLIYNAAPKGTFDRLGTMAELRQVGDLNQRVNIWSAGWRAFQTAPIVGHGAGAFVTAAELGSEDTAHNTVISILVEGGLCGLALGMSVVVSVVQAIRRTEGPLRFALAMLMLIWALSSLSGTVWENRLTWLLFGIAAVCPALTKRDGDRAEGIFDTAAWSITGDSPEAAG